MFRYIAGKAIHIASQSHTTQFLDYIIIKSASCKIYQPSNNMASQPQLQPLILPATRKIKLLTK